jgi:hypothetical protein
MVYVEEDFIYLLFHSESLLGLIDSLLWFIYRWLWQREHSIGILTVHYTLTRTGDTHKSLSHIGQKAE